MRLLFVLYDRILFIKLFSTFQLQAYHITEGLQWRPRLAQRHVHWNYATSTSVRRLLGWDGWPSGKTECCETSRHAPVIGPSKSYVGYDFSEWLDCLVKCSTTMCTHPCLLSLLSHNMNLPRTVCMCVWVRASRPIGPRCCTHAHRCLYVISRQCVKSHLMNFQLDKK